MQLLLRLLFVFATTATLWGCQKSLILDTGTINLVFINKVNGAPLVLNTDLYTNPFNETYTVSKFKYYITNINVLSSGNAAAETNSYHLVDQNIASSQRFGFSVPANTFTNISFLLGVDSTRNVSGAQTGALDPLNDMFWTWNSGYVMAKLEGNSPQSAQVGNKFEYHLGGFKGANSVLKNITLSFPVGKIADIKAGQTTEITIEADINTWWQDPGTLKIGDLPICTTPGVQAKMIADNYSKMFTITNVVNNK